MTSFSLLVDDVVGEYAGVVADRYLRPAEERGKGAEGGPSFKAFSTALPLTWPGFRGVSDRTALMQQPHTFLTPLYSYFSEQSIRLGMASFEATAVWYLVSSNWLSS